MEYKNIAFILEDGSIFREYDDEEGAKCMISFGDIKVIGYIIIDGYEDADDDEILKAFKNGFKDFKYYFECVKDAEDYYNDPYAYNGVSHSNF